MNRTTCFVFGNLWLVIALVLFLGGEAVRYAPTRIAFFGVGAWFVPGAYRLLVLASAAMGLWLLTVGIRRQSGE